MTNKENLTTLCLGGFKKDNISELLWVLENFAAAADIKIYSGIKVSYDCERDSYTLSFRFFKEPLSTSPPREPLSDEDGYTTADSMLAERNKEERNTLLDK